MEADVLLHPFMIDESLQQHGLLETRAFIKVVLGVDSCRFRLVRQGVGGASNAGQQRLLDSRLCIAMMMIMMMMMMMMVVDSITLRAGGNVWVPVITPTMTFITLIYCRHRETGLKG